MHKHQERRSWRSQTLRLTDLRLTSDRQRPLNEAKAQDIASDKPGKFGPFDKDQVRTIKVCRFPNGDLAVADGQHTARALIIRGWIYADCEVIDVADETEFRNVVDLCNPTSDALTVVQRFWMDRGDGRADAMAICDEVDRAGMELVKDRANKMQLDCVAAILRIVKDGGCNALRSALLFHRSAFPDQPIHDYTLEGVHLLLKTCESDPAFDRTKLIKRLLPVPFATIKKRTGQEVKAEKVSGKVAFARMIKETYNEETGRKGRHIKTDIP